MGEVRHLTADSKNRRLRRPGLVRHPRHQYDDHSRPACADKFSGARAFCLLFRMLLDFTLHTTSKPAGCVSCIGTDAAPPSPFQWRKFLPDRPARPRENGRLAESRSATASLRTINMLHISGALARLSQTCWRSARRNRTRIQRTGPGLLRR
jgi:hypothetical protein